MNDVQVREREDSLAEIETADETAAIDGPSEMVSAEHDSRHVSTESRESRRFVDLLRSVKLTALHRWPYTFIVIVSIVIAVAAVISSWQLGLPLKDPNGFLGPAYIRFPVLTALCFTMGIGLAVVKRRAWRRLPGGIVEAVKYEWTAHRIVYTVTGIVSFYVCYIAYRNLKNDLPFFRTGVLYDKQFLRLDRVIAFGHSPDVLLHKVLGTTVMADILSMAYLAYLPLVPISLCLFLLLDHNVRNGAWYATTLCLNWVLGVVSYYALPTLGPAFARPEYFWGLPYTSVTELQDSLLRARLDVLANPATSSEIQGVAAFASLHVSVTFAAALFMQRTNRRRIIRIITWTFFVLIVLATLYFGWHYIIDDIAGVLIGWLTVSIGAWASGSRRLRRARRDSSATATAHTYGSGAD